MMNKAIFLDRDGTIAVDVHYCSRPDDFVFLPTVLTGFKLLSESEFKIIVITNQSGLARGYFNEEVLKNIHDKMQAKVRNSGGRIDAIYYCPHHPDDKCACRKPNIGMIQKAASEWNIQLKDSYFIGDKYLDVETANRAGCKAIIIPNSAPELDLLNGDNSYKVKIDRICPDFISAAGWILQESNIST
jgi:D-glycero-D-manno-heptose 1,7-bisphosphate phosphatase